MKIELIIVLSVIILAIFVGTILASVSYSKQIRDNEKPSLNFITGFLVVIELITLTVLWLSYESVNKFVLNLLL